jgi:N6-L-threonylcarbamoyladenine synthase
MSSTHPRVLAIESSCDETACAVVEGHRVLASIVSSQVAVHRPFGGVVPELASRHHLEAIVGVVGEAMTRAEVTFADIDALAVTQGPGLIGALLVGVQMARGLAATTGLPLFGIHHMEGHLFSAVLGDAERAPDVMREHVALLVSGGHSELVHVRRAGSYRLLGATRDDAAGEAFDKAAKLLGLGYPGGPIIDALAAEGDPQTHTFPRAMIERDDFEFSFSGLKTALLVHVERHGQPDSRRALADLCASFQAAIVDVLVAKASRAVRACAVERVHVVGGVAANSALRTSIEAAARRERWTAVLPPLRYCGDNAAMIGAAACARIAAGCSPTTSVHTTIALDDPRVQFS